MPESARNNKIEPLRGAMNLLRSPHTDVSGTAEGIRDYVDAMIAEAFRADIPLSELDPEGKKDNAQMRLELLKLEREAIIRFGQRIFSQRPVALAPPGQALDYVDNWSALLIDVLTLADASPSDLDADGKMNDEGIKAVLRDERAAAIRKDRSAPANERRSGRSPAL